MKVLRVWFKEGISVGRHQETLSVLNADKAWALDWDPKNRELGIVEVESGYSYVVPVENVKLMRREDAKA